MTKKIHRTRENLIALCEQGIVPVEKWVNEFMPGAQQQLSHCCSLLKAGCSFEASTQGIDDYYYVQVTCPTFETITEKKPWTRSGFYIPTETRLKASKGGDWY